MNASDYLCLPGGSIRFRAGFRARPNSTFLLFIYLHKIPTTFTRLSRSHRYSLTGFTTYSHRAVSSVVRTTLYVTALTFYQTHHHQTRQETTHVTVSTHLHFSPWSAAISAGGPPKVAYHLTSHARRTGAHGAHLLRSTRCDCSFPPCSPFSIVGHPPPGRRSAELNAAAAPIQR